MLKIKWTRLHVADNSGQTPDSDNEGFWPSLDPSAAGYIGADPARSYEEQMEDARERLAAFNRGDWGFIGVRARAELAIPIGGGCSRLMTVESAGLWGIESDSDSDYLASVFADEREALKAELAELGRCLAAGEVEEEEAAEYVCI
jgi:hypothetical protein